MEKTYKLKIRFSGESIDKYGVNLYDGSTSFYGISQAIQIVFNAYINNKVISSAPGLRGGKVFFGGPRRGSVLIDLILLAEKYPVVAGASGAVLYDFIKFALSKAVGKFENKPETKSVQDLADDELFFDQLSETIEGSLKRAHRAIDYGVKHISIERPRSSLLTFDWETSQWVNTLNENPLVEEFTGNITRYNSITGNGRAFIKELKKVIPFRLVDKFPANHKGLLTWSLHGDNIDKEKGLKFWASKIESAGGHPKRLLLTDCTKLNTV